MTTWIDCDVRYAEHRARVARGERDAWRRGRQTPAALGPAAAPPVLARYVRGAHNSARLVAAALGRLATHAHDSRDGLRSKEQELAAYGVRWSADPAADQILATDAGPARRPEPRPLPLPPAAVARA